MANKTTSEYLLMVTSQYQNSPKFLDWLTIVIEMCKGSQDCIEQIYKDFDIDNAVGAQLDVLGKIIGQSRYLDFDPPDGSEAELTDADFRKVLKLKSFTNYWDGTLGNLYDAWNAVFPDCELLIHDNQNMTANISLTGKLTNMIKEMIYRDLIIPRPEGVQYFFTGDAPETAAQFYYDYNDTDNDYRKGYDKGYWDITI